MTSVRRSRRRRRRPIALGTVIAAALLALTILAVVSTNGIPLLSSYQLEVTLPPDGAPIQSGSEVRVAGLVVGLVQRVSATASGQRVVFSIGGAASPVGRDATVTERLLSPAGGHYLAVDRGSYRADPAPGGFQIPPAQVHRTEDLLDVIQGFNRAALADLATTTRFTGFGLAGRGAGLNAALARVDLTAGRLTAILQAATPGDAQTLFLHGADLTAHGLAGIQPNDPGRLTTASAGTFGAFANQHAAIAAQLQELRPTENELLRTLPTVDQTLRVTTALSHKFTPAVAALRSALPDFAALLSTGPTLRTESAQLTTAGTAPLSRLPGPLRAFGPSAEMIGLATQPLGPLGAYLSGYGRELGAGFAAFYAANFYVSPQGQAPYTEAAPAMFIFTCATGSDINPAPGQLFGDHLPQPCK
ncbi:MAG: MlaD family protein [Solirubrobacteraceae bacterium]